MNLIRIIQTYRVVQILVIVIPIIIIVHYNFVVIPWKTHLSLVVNINSREEDADIDSDYLSGDVDPEVHVEKVKDHQLLLQQFSYKNISDLTDQELSSFFRVKEKIYDERRKRVQEYCDTQGGFQIEKKKLKFPIRAGSLTTHPLPL